MLEDISMGGCPFDEDLFMYLEDVDVSWRGQLRGHKCLFVPNAVVYHKLSATGGGETASYYVGRNTPYVITKNYPSALMRKYGLRVIGAQVAEFARALPHIRYPASRARLRGMLAFLRLLPKALRERERIQSTVTTDTDQIDQRLEGG